MLKQPGCRSTFPIHPTDTPVQIHPTDTPAGRHRPCCGSDPCCAHEGLVVARCLFLQLSPQQHHHPVLFCLGAGPHGAFKRVRERLQSGALAAVEQRESLLPACLAIARSDRTVDVLRSQIEPRLQWRIPRRRSLRVWGWGWGGLAYLYHQPADATYLDVVAACVTSYCVMYVTRDAHTSSSSLTRAAATSHTPLVAHDLSAAEVTSRSTPNSCLRHLATRLSTCRADGGCGRIASGVGQDACKWPWQRGGDDSPEPCGARGACVCVG